MMNVSWDDNLCYLVTPYEANLFETFLGFVQRKEKKEVNERRKKKEKRKKNKEKKKE